MSPSSVGRPRLGDLVIAADGVRLIVIQVRCEIVHAEPEFCGGPERAIAQEQLRPTDPGVWQEVAR